MSKHNYIVQLPVEMICYIGDILGMEKVALGLTCKSLYYALGNDLYKIRKLYKALKKTPAISYTISHVHNDINFILKKYLIVSIRTISTCLRNIPVEDKLFIYRRINFKVKPRITVYEVFVNTEGQQTNYNTNPVEFTVKNFKAIGDVLWQYFQNIPIDCFRTMLRRYRSNEAGYNSAAYALVELLDLLVKHQYGNVTRDNT